MDLACDCSLLPPDLARCLDLGSPSGPGELAGDPQPGQGEACPTRRAAPGACGEPGCGGAGVVCGTGVGCSSVWWALVFPGVGHVCLTKVLAGRRTGAPPGCSPDRVSGMQELVGSLL